MITLTREELREYFSASSSDTPTDRAIDGMEELLVQNLGNEPFMKALQEILGIEDGDPYQPMSEENIRENCSFTDRLIDMPQRDLDKIRDLFAALPGLKLEDG